MVNFGEVYCKQGGVKASTSLSWILCKETFVSFRGAFQQESRGWKNLPLCVHPNHSSELGAPGIHALHSCFPHC